MRRELPTRPHIDHLRAQAKELLDGHRRRDPAALARLRAALPAYANASDELIAKSGVALHDAQSAIAREYGFPSWAALRKHVLSAQASPDRARFVESLFGQRLAEPLRAALRDAWSKSDVEALSAIATPETLPLLAARNTLLSPGAIAPLMIGRPASVAALLQATQNEPPLIGVFAQRNEGTESPRFEELHRVGCLAFVRSFLPGDAGTAWVVLEGMRWIELEAIAAVDPCCAARVTPNEVTRGDPVEVETLGAELRTRAQTLAETFGERKAAALAFLEEIDDVGRLSDLVVANLPCSVAEKAAYAAEPTLATRLRAALELVQRTLTGALAGERP